MIQFSSSVILVTNQVSNAPSEAQVAPLLNYKTAEVLWAWWLSGIVLTQSTPLTMEFSVQLFLYIGEGTAREHGAFKGQLLCPTILAKRMGRKAAPALPVLITLL